MEPFLPGLAPDERLEEMGAGMLSGGGKVDMLLNLMAPIQLVRKPDGKFAPKGGGGGKLKSGLKVKVPHKSGKGHVNGVVNGSSVDLTDGPDKGKKAHLH